MLAPDIVEAIVAGKTDQGMMLEQLERPLRVGRSSSGVLPAERPGRTSREVMFDKAYSSQGGQQAGDLVRALGRDEGEPADLKDQKAMYGRLPLPHTRKVHDLAGSAGIELA